MRVHSRPPMGPSRPADAAPHAAAAPAFTNATGPLRFIRGALRNSPWVVIAISAHVVGITLLSVLYVTSHEAPAQVAQIGRVALHDRPVEEDAPELLVPEVVPRDAVPVSTAAATDAPVNPSEVIEPDNPPGLRGPIFDSKEVDKAPGEFNPDEFAPPDLPAGASGGTSIGVGRIGHVGTGIASAFVSRVPGGGGKGGGGPGQGGENGPGARAAKDPSREGVMLALRWLRNHQAADGRWDGDGFDANCKLNRCDGPGDSTYDPGLTGLSLLAFLGAGETHQSGTCRTTVKNGLKYLRDVQDSEGCFGPRTSQHFLYNHACAALAMTEAYGMTGSRIFKEPAERGIGFVLRSRNPYLAWRYNVPPDGDNDTSVTGWMVMALKSAKLSGLEIERQPIEDAIAWVEKMTEPEFGRTGYQQRGGPPARTNEAAARFPNSKSESLTAVGMTVRIFGGRDPAKDEMIGKGAALLSKCLPRWDLDQGTNDFYYWYYGSLAMFQVGGPQWRKWNEAMKTAILDHQSRDKERCEYGSWAPQDCWSAEGGRVYSTAINCLTMEVYYRYPLLGVRSNDPK